MKERQRKDGTINLLLHRILQQTVKSFDILALYKFDYYYYYNNITVC